MDVKNMTAGQIANMSLEQFNKLTAAEAKQALAIVRRSVNQRIRRLNAGTDYSSPALEAMKRSGGERLKPASSSRSSNLSELKRGIDFLNNKTSTVKGSRAHFAQTKKDLGLSDKATAQNVKDAYETFNRAKEEFGGMLSKESGAEKYNALKQKIGEWSERGAEDEDIRAAIHTFYERAEANEAASAADILRGIDNEFFISNEDPDDWE